MLSLFAGADAVHNLSEAPAALPESALAIDLIAQMLNERDIYSDEETIEQASAVSVNSGPGRTKTGAVMIGVEGAGATVVTGAGAGVAGIVRAVRA